MRKQDNEKIDIQRSYALNDACINYLYQLSDYKRNVEVVIGKQHENKD
jgi:hypothetical protein